MLEVSNGLSSGNRSGSLSRAVLIRAQASGDVMAGTGAMLWCHGGDRSDIVANEGDSCDFIFGIERASNVILSIMCLI